jgi:uncharacterized protein (DUF2147 family)
VKVAGSRIIPTPPSALIPTLSLALILALMQGSAPSAGAERPPPGVPGLWLTQDRGGVISAETCGDRLCLRIAGVVLDHSSDTMPLDSHGVSQCGLQLVDGAVEVEPNLWRGKILDPRNGKLYSVQLWLNPDGTLALRGFLGVALLGRTETWTRYPGGVPADCRLSPQEIAAAVPPP